ncbi:Hint domain-containing protein [Sinisalibacter aestuarii]|uniref:Hedgehog/Intein (Hint) domain-containing protein n=1 Tax=Sinisalibacter aestuarii TaxID=2949426 RepID=A0ABQ5LMK2_9RHOB|nr:Hint domain-containing protein [Sinisalibacter aestuarii]GKY86254.1 hypothetical protein STA1M1_01230 [Sinisalibacter aestuarii]
MSWIAVTDLTRPLFNIRGIGVAPDAPGARPPVQPDEILPRGTMMLELRYNVEPGVTQTLLDYHRSRGWARSLRVTLDGAGVLRVSSRQGLSGSEASIRLPMPARDSRLRVSYAWDAPLRQGLLTVEMLDEGQMYQAGVAAPVPLPVEDLRLILRNTGPAQIAANVIFLAFADSIEPVGFGIGILAGTLVDTASGPVPVERLRLGDPVTTATSGRQPVRWIGKRTVPAFGSFQPVRLRKPFFGLNADVTLAPDHRVRIDFAEAEYILGTDEVLLPAAHLLNGQHARHERSNRLVTYYQVLLDVHDCLLHAGIWAESLYVGTIARRPDVARSTVLGDMPGTAIPQHRAFSHHRLNDVEARSLASALRHA